MMEDEQPECTEEPDTMSNAEKEEENNNQAEEQLEGLNVSMQHQ
jgi:hypothetical protein